MKYINLFFAIALAYAICPCEAKNRPADEIEVVGNEAAKISKMPQDCSDLIKTVYEQFVFAIDAEPDMYAHPEQVFTSNALQKLKDCYEFDCESENCYAFYEFRTQEQDSKPGTEGESRVLDIESLGDDWYMVKYTDMGWSGMTRIKIIDGKIDDFERCVED